jgi:rhodanese-related sulfurtransferase
LNTVTVDEAKRLIEAGEVHVVDVREPVEFQAGRIDSALLIPMSAFEIGAIPTDKPVIFVCRSANRSGQVTQYMQQRRDDVYNMTGGMKAWQSAGYPMAADISPATII